MRIVCIEGQQKGWHGTVIGYSKRYHNGDTYLDVRFDKEYFNYHDDNLEWYEPEADCHDRIHVEDVVLEEIYNTKLWNVLE